MSTTLDIAPVTGAIAGDNIIDAEFEFVSEAQIKKDADEAAVAAAAPAPKVNSVLTDVLNRKYDAVFESGTLCSLNVSVWGMAARLKEADLGVAKQPKHIKLGKKMIIDDKILNEFKGVETQARNFLYRLSFPFPVAQAHFVPNTKLAILDETLITFKEKFEALMEKFFAQYETFKKEMTEAHENVSEEDYPSLAEVKKKFGFSWAKFRISMPVPKEMQEVSLGEQIAEEKAVSEVKAKALADLKKQAESQTALIHNFTQEAGELLRKRILDYCLKVTDQIKAGKVIRKSNIQGLIKQATDFKDLNFLDDSAVAEHLDGLLEVLNNGGADFKTSKADIAQLEKALTAVTDEAAKPTGVSELTGRYFRHIDVED